MTPSPKNCDARDRWLPLVGGLVALLPWIIWHRLFSQLFWFGDEFDLIDQIDRTGFGPWVWQVFAENFVPVFKLLWGGAVFAFHGSYGAMIALVWLTHAANVYLLGRVMRVAGFSWIAVAVAQVVVGLSPSNIETLGWSVQWSAVLATAFMMAAFLGLLTANQRAHDGGKTSPALVLAASLASAWSFSRGVLTGACLALGSVISGGRPLLSRASRGALWLAPAVLTAALIAAFAKGNHEHLGGHTADMVHYALCFICLNPARDSLGLGSVEWGSILGLGALKAGFILWGLWRARGAQRTLLVLLLAYDLGNAVLLGIGRFHTGFETSTSSRYQYSSLVVALPFVGFALSDALALVPGKLRAVVASLALVLLAYGVMRGWPDSAGPFCGSRGAESRRTLLGTADPGPYAVPGIPFMTTERGRELIAKYHLH